MITVLFSESSLARDYLSFVCSQSGNQCFCVSTLTELMLNLCGINPDLVIVNNKTFPKPSFDIQKHIKSENKKYPVAFIGDDIIDPFELWTFESEEESAFYYEYMNSLQSAISLFHFIVNMKNYNQNSNLSVEVKILKSLYGINNRHINLFRIFAKNPERKISTQEIMETLWGKFDKNKTSTLYSIIHQVNLLIAQQVPHAKIIRDSKGVYTLKTSK